jgi:thymidylate synthase (FAD)
MTVKLLHSTPLWVASTAIRKCWASEDKSDTDEDMKCNLSFANEIGEKDKALIDRVGNKNKHSSTLEHLNYSFDIDGISRACLQELARHRHASLSVKSTRYTLKELKQAPSILEEGFNFFSKNAGTVAKQFLVMTKNSDLDGISVHNLGMLQLALQGGVSNDIAKYALPESYKTSLVWTVNARSLQNFLSLRTDKSALWEIRDLAKEIFAKLPEEHKYLFKDFVKEY